MAKILVVDGDAETRRLLVVHLGSLGHEVTCVEHPRAAAACLADQPWDLVVLDVLFGKEPAGLELLSRIRDDPWTRHVPVVVYTALDGDGDHGDRAAELGVGAFLTKVGTRFHQVGEAVGRLCGPPPAGHADPGPAFPH